MAKTAMFAALLALALPGIARADQTPDASPPDPLGHPEDSQVLDTDTDRHRRLTIPVQIGGQGPFEFMIDTGSQATVVSRQLSERLQLEAIGTGTLVGIASSRQVDLVELDGLEFADRVFDNLTSPLLEEQYVGADGIIGLDSLQDLRVLIDFRSETISVADAQSNIGRNGYEIIVRARRKLGQLIITDAEIEGVRTALIIDTGSQFSIGNSALREKIRSRRTSSLTAIDVNGVAIVGDLTIAHQLSFGGMRFTDIPIAYADSPAFAALGYADRPALSLGMMHLRLFDRVAIDFSKRQVLFDLPRSVSRRDRTLRGGRR